MADPAKPENKKPENKIESLRRAVAFFLEDNFIDRFEADGLRTLILQDGPPSEAERLFLQEVLAHSNFDSEALALLQELLES